MKRPVLVFTMGLLTFWLAACANTPPAPEWQASSYGALSGFTSAFLTGNSKVADIEFAHARSDISSTGRADLVVRADLVRCALRVASVEFDNCAATALTNTDVAEPERAYADYLSGRWQSLDGNRIALLPEQHRAVVAAKDDTTRLRLVCCSSRGTCRLRGSGLRLIRHPPKDGAGPCWRGWAYKSNWQNPRPTTMPRHVSRGELTWYWKSPELEAEPKIGAELM
jgi:hypothetical protein